MEIVGPYAVFLFPCAPRLVFCVVRFIFPILFSRAILARQLFYPVRLDFME
jgi:hypothetical protein